MTQTPMNVEEILKGERDCGEEERDSDELCVRIASMAELPTRYGLFRVYAFYNNRDGKEHAALVRGTVEGAENVPVRVHSECLTGDVLGSLRCDCRDQLEAALKAIGKMDKGIVLYMRQEGRGIGFVNKIRAYGLQDHGYDTVEANLALGFRDDEREYGVAAHMLHALKVKSIQLMTNNLRKVDDLTRNGIAVSGRIPHVMTPNKFNRFYLETKANKSGHLIDFQGNEHMQEQCDRPIVRGMSRKLVEVFAPGK
jgi:GTP cyclohydrolase II